jgi:hypothetical protein
MDTSQGLSVPQMLKEKKKLKKCEKLPTFAFVPTETSLPEPN